jgi:hypothetical protein
VRGEALGAFQRVVLSEPQQGVLREGLLDGGRYTCEIPRIARTPVVVLHGAGGALVRSATILLTEDQEGYELPTVALWEAAIRAREEDGVLRFDWPPLPAGRGLPEVFRYSLLITYTKRDGSEGEASLLSREPAMTIPKAELLELLKDRDPAATRFDLSIRAFDPAVTEGALWVGSSREWSLKP